MTFLLKAILLSSVFLPSDNSVFEVGSYHQKSQDKNLQKAIEDLTLSSYIQFMDSENKAVVELQQSACELGLGKACWYYAYSTGRLEDFVHAKEILTRHCYAMPSSRQSGEACTFLGIMSSQGQTQIQESEQELYKRGCELGDGWGCYRLARDFLIEEDFMQAQKINSKALRILSDECKDGSAASCYFAGTLYKQPFVEDWVDCMTQQTNMRYFFTEGCDLGDGDACYALNDVHLTCKNTVDENK